MTFGKLADWLFHGIHRILQEVNEHENFMPIQRIVLQSLKFSFKNFPTLVNNLVLSVLIKYVNLNILG